MKIIKIKLKVQKIYYINWQKRVITAIKDTNKPRKIVEGKNDMIG